MSSFVIFIVLFVGEEVSLNSRATFFLSFFFYFVETNFSLSRYLSLSLSLLQITDLTHLRRAPSTRAAQRLRQIDDYCQERTVSGWKCGWFQGT